MERQTVNKRVYSLGYSEDEIPEKASEFMTFWQEKIDRVPEEHRDRCRVRIELEDDYGYPVISAEVRYSRPETDDEVSYRVSEQQGRLERNERLQREQYERLKAKYE